MAPEGWAISREPDDTLADVRVSIGSLDSLGAYIVFRGDPAATVALLERAVEAARVALASGAYQDKRGRPQG